MFTRVFAAVYICIVTYAVFRKKHALTFSFMSSWKMFRFPQNFQRMFRRKLVFHWCKN